MPYIPDLELCTYLMRGDTTAPRLLAVGWLAAGHPFPTGPVDPQVVERLRAFQQAPGKLLPLYMGHHICELCDERLRAQLDLPPGAFSTLNLAIPGEQEIYAAPEGIIHYIEDHGYAPPPAFCEAVLRAPLPHTPEYRARVEELMQTCRVPLSAERSAAP